MEKNIPLNSIELAQEKDFIQWVKHGCDDSFNAWYLIKQDQENNHELEEAVALVQESLKLNKAYSSGRAEQLFSRINKSIQQKHPVHSKSSIRYLYWISSAAAACFLILFVFKTSDLESFETNYAEQQVQYLPEGSEVTLNADTDLSFKKKSFAKSRKLELEGEAFFEVKKGDSFIVETEYGNVEVLGTSFNVYAREDRFEVSCHTGKVKVSNKQNNSFVILTPGQESLLDQGKIRKIERNYADKDWMDGVFHFEDESLKNVASEIERQFNIKINMSEQIEKLEYTGFFENDKLDEAFNSVLWPLRLELEKESDTEYKIVLSKE